MAVATASAAANPGQSPEELKAHHANQGGEDMATHEVPRLRQGAARGAEDQHRRGPEGPDHEPLIQDGRQDPTHQGHGPDPEKGPDPGPQYLGIGDPGGLPRVVPRIFRR